MDQSFAFSTTWNILIPLLPIDAQRCWIRSDAACYHLQMITALKQMLPRIESWPPDDQQALVEAARGIEAERSGVYHASPEELAAIDRGLDDSRHGRFASEQAVEAVHSKFRDG
jgi:hypothetical protein